jgi:hypothetical protein
MGYIEKITKHNNVITNFAERLQVRAKNFNNLVEKLLDLGISDDGINPDKVVITKSNITQITAITTGVTVAGTAGVITTVSTTVAAGSNASFTVTAPDCLSTSVVQLTVDDSATAGLAKLNVQTVADGSFVVNITNVHSTNAFNNVIKIHYLIV